MPQSYKLLMKHWGATDDRHHDGLLHHGGSAAVWVCSLNASYEPRLPGSWRVSASQSYSLDLGKLRLRTRGVVRYMQMPSRPHRGQPYTRT